VGLREDGGVGVGRADGAAGGPIGVALGRPDAATQPRRQAACLAAGTAGSGDSRGCAWRDSRPRNRSPCRTPAQPGCLISDVPGKYSYIRTPEVAWRVLWEVCVIAPVVEEILYRGVPLLALERVCGRGWAVALCGLIWASLHFIYGHPLVRAPWFFFYGGVLLAWIFLKSRSVLTTVLLHAICNLVVALDLVLLFHGDAVLRLLGQE